MMTWILSHIGSIITGLLLLVAIACAIFSMHNNKKKGNKGCGGSCEGCTHSDSCRK